jgi:glutathione S-transferase
MIELYYLEEADSICSNRVIMTLAEKEIVDWVPHKMSLVNRDQFKPKYLKLNSKAQVPTLVHDGKVVKESSIICNYIDDLRPSPSLKPANPVDRATLQEWIKDCDESGYQAAASINFVTKFRLEIPREVMEERWKHVTDIDRLHRQQSCVYEGMESPYVLRAVGAWDRILGNAERILSDGRPWIMGDQYTLVETIHAPLIKVLEMLRLLHLWVDGRPNVQDWWERVTRRESFNVLDEYPGQRQDDDTPHARAGTKLVNEFDNLLSRYRDLIRPV